MKKYWGNNYGYDAWGNLIDSPAQSRPTKPAPRENLIVTADAHNWIHAIRRPITNMTPQAT